MARQPQSEGMCQVCKSPLKKGSMSKHLQSCLTKQQQEHKGKSTKNWILQVDGGGPYWLYLQARSNATLEDIDHFLRDTWLECCGHLSAFYINDQTYSDGLNSGNEDLNVRLEEVLRPQMKIGYEYDFGSTTELLLKVISEQDTPNQKKVMLLARNDAPDMRCGHCGKPAKEICMECVWEKGDGLFCSKCFAKHECEEEMALPVVNSPRMGVCGYEG